MIKANSEVCINNVSPNVAVNIWNKIPIPEAAPEKHAASLPWLKPRPIAKILSGPGDITKNKHASVYAIQISIGNINYPWVCYYLAYKPRLLGKFFRTKNMKSDQGLML